MDDLIDQLAQIDPLIIDQAYNAIMKRYAELFPDYEFVAVSLRKEEDRSAQIDGIIQWLQTLKAIP